MAKETKKIFSNIKDKESRVTAKMRYAALQYFDWALFSNTFMINEKKREL